MSNVMIGPAGRVGNMKLFLHLHSFANTLNFRWVRSVIINTWHTVLDKFRDKEKLEEKMCWPYIAPSMGTGPPRLLPFIMSITMVNFFTGVSFCIVAVGKNRSYRSGPEALFTSRWVRGSQVCKWKKSVFTSSICEIFYQVHLSNIYMKQPVLMFLQNKSHVLR